MCSEILDVWWWSVGIFENEIYLLFEWIDFSDCDDGSDEEQRYCRKDKNKIFKN
jgi:hypothetical protein